MADSIDGPLTQQEYLEKGRHSPQTVQDRFGGWNAAKEKIGLPTAGRGGKRRSDEEILAELERVAQEIEGDVTRELFDRESPISDQTVQRRFESFREAKKEAGIHGQKFELWEDALTELHGWLTLDELVETLEEETAVNCTFTPACHMEELLNFVNNRENGLTLKNAHSNGGNGTRVFVKNENIDRYAEYKEKISEDHLDAFENLVSYGKNPKTVAATISYLTSDKSQRDTASEFGCTAVSIRNNKQDVAEEIGIDPDAATSQ